ncbi:ribonuclease H-like YkuK family protein [Hungatella hathewayi]|uniref:ribonuclease H-like YkuK family protein n=1 Tax=Hungatella hathewayi TaxID=154046 RepID=UPI00356A0ABE
MISPTYGKVSIKQVADILNSYYQNNKQFGAEFSLTVGTDSQNFSDTKVVVVVAMRCIGHGGIYFYEVSHVDKIQNVKQKLNYETSLSLDLANAIMNILENNQDYEELFLNSNFSIHVDAGHSPKGKTKELIPEIVGWIRACGYECVVKPDSYTASSIADRISK